MTKKTIISKEEVLHVAKLARLSLTDSEVNLYTTQIEAILEYVNTLSEVDTSAVKPTFQVLDGTKNILREDVLVKGFSQEEALSQAERTHNGFFVADDVFAEKSEIRENKKVTEKRTRVDKYNAVLEVVDPNGNLGHKDLFMTKGVKTTAGSLVLENYKAHYSGTISKDLEKAGYKTKYKLNQDAWGHGSSGENSDFGPTSNPWNTKRVAGGSSSGSGVSVLTGDVEVSTGTDTCGSIRMPANFLNLTGIKPSYGALSRYGVIAFASSLDCPGFIARDVKKLKKAFNVVFKSDPSDATSQSTARNEVKSTSIKKIGIVSEFLEGGLDVDIKDRVNSAVGTFENLGYEFVGISLPHAKYGIAAYYLIAPTETSSNLSRYDGVRFGRGREYFGAEAKRRIMIGTFASSAGYSAKYYEKAARVRSLIIEDFTKAFLKVDAILAPVSPVPAFLLGEKTGDPLKMYLTDIFAAPASLAGLPSLALPCGFTQTNLPVGLQVIGKRFDENALFDLGETFQSKTDFHLQNIDESK